MEFDSSNTLDVASPPDSKRGRPEERTEEKPPNRFLLIPLTAPGMPRSFAVELPYNQRVPLGRRSNNIHLNNLHISREQVAFELKPDYLGRILICMTNKGKNSTRVLSIARRKQARVTNSTYCRLVPGDVVELLYDQQGRYAFKLIETSPDGSPLSHHTPLVPSVSLFYPPPDANAADTAQSNATSGTVATEEAMRVAGTLDGPVMRLDVGEAGAISVLPAGFRGDVRRGEGSDGEVLPSPPLSSGVRGGARRGEGSDADEHWDEEEGEGALGGLEGLEARPGLAIDVGHRDVARSVVLSARDEESGGMKQLPGPLLGMVLSNLPFAEIIRASSVCKEWHAEIKKPGNISLADVGSLFAGVVPPDPRIIDSIATNVCARDYSFANCLWLSTGALLHMIGVPLGAVPSSRLPLTQAMQPDAPQPAREAAAWDIVNSIASAGLDGADFLSCANAAAAKAAGDFPYIPPSGSLALPVDGGSVPKPIDSAPIDVPRHSFLRYYVGELMEAHVGSPASAVAHPTLRIVGSTPPASASGIDTNSGATSPALNARTLPTASVDSESDASPVNFGSDAESVSGQGAVSVDARVEVCTPVTLSPEASSSLFVARSKDAWWAGIEDAIPFAHAAAFSVLNHSQPPALPQYSESTVLPHGAVARVPDAQVSSVDMASLRYSFPTTEMPASGNPMAQGGWGSLSPFDLATVLVHSEVVKARAVSQYSRLLSTSISIAQARSPSYGLLVARGYLEMSLACRLLLKRYKAAKESGARDASFLLSGANVMESLSIIGASTIFPPIQDLRRGVQQNITQGQKSEESKSQGHLIGDALAAALGEHAAVHALSASYATAAADVYDFIHSLVTVKNGGSLDVENLPNGLSGHGVSFELPWPEQNLSRGRRASEQRLEASALPTFSTLPNVIGAALPRVLSSPITGLDLSGCTRLAPQNLHLILEYCPHLVSLRLGGCSQFAADVLVSVAPLLKNIVYLDLEYCSLAVNDDVCAAIGKHCPNLLRLQLVGCHDITDAGLGERGLFGVCTNLRRLNLRGCKNIGDAGILSLASRAPHLRELCLAGLTTVTAPALATLVASCKRLTRFKAELWYEGDAPGATATDAVNGETRRSFRLMGSVRSALRYLRTAIAADHPALPVLVARYAKETGARDGNDSVSKETSTRKAETGVDRDVDDHDSLDSWAAYGPHARHLVDGDGPFAPTTNEVYMHQGSGNACNEGLPAHASSNAPGTPPSNLREVDVVSFDPSTFRTPPHPTAGPAQHLRHPEQARERKSDS